MYSGWVELEGDGGRIMYAWNCASPAQAISFQHSFPGLCDRVLADLDPDVSKPFLVSEEFSA